MRNGEQNGREYNFVSTQQFEDMQANNQFIEFAKVHGNYYGTSRVWLEQELQQNKQILLEIDWQGASQIKQIFEHITNVVYIFILPPSIDELKNRLISRGQDSDEVIQTRIAGAKHEIVHAVDADYIVINKDFNIALESLLGITKTAVLMSSIQLENNKELMSGLGIY
jgi:guanylate kinase